jgi:hypothetical protein
MVNRVGPFDEYVSRRDRWRDQQEVLQGQFIRIGNWRLSVGISAAVVAFVSIGRGAISSWWLLLPLALFIALAVWHARVLHARTRAERGVRYYQSAFSRLNDDWAGKGNPGDGVRAEDHVYADDLDIFGKGGLFDFLSTTRTSAGEATLASWLLAPAALESAQQRQQAVRELSAHLDLREDLALLGEDIRSGVHADRLSAWGTARPIEFAPFVRPFALGLSILGLASLIAFFAQALPLWVFAAVFVAGIVFRFSVRKRVVEIVNAFEISGLDLVLLSLTIERLERERFESPLLSHLRSELDVAGLAASGRITKLRRWIELLDSSEHMIVRVVRPFLLWQEQAAMGVEAWRHVSGAYIGRWVHAIGEFEALCSLATLAFERPNWSFPELMEGTEPQFKSTALRHPLIADSRCVPNDVALGNGVRLLVVSGSNMSGKSTLLRAVGLNCVLAWAGGPVAANRLQISRLDIGASIRVVDSLQDNRSRFFTEITRIRKIVEMTRSGSHVLFLLDELLSGTNSHDRVIGAAGIVRALLRAGAIGLISTHDLALTGIAKELGSGIMNVHLEDEICGGEINFDYKLRPGVATRSNGLELMRVVGLEV